MKTDTIYFKIKKLQKELKKKYSLKKYDELIKLQKEYNEDDEE